MSKLKSEKYKGWTIKFSKMRDNVFTEVVKGSKRYDVPVSSTKEEGLAKAKAGIDNFEVGILYKSRFNDWINVDKKKALALAKTNYSGITTMSGAKKVDYINSKFKGIKFTKSQMEA